MCLVHPQESSELKQAHSSLKEQLRIKEEVWNGKGGGGKEEDGGRKRRGWKRHMGVARRSVTCLIVFPPPQESLRLEQAQAVVREQLKKTEEVCASNCLLHLVSPLHHLSSGEYSARTGTEHP